jgi:hypothetical protein
MIKIPTMASDNDVVKFAFLQLCQNKLLYDFMAALNASRSRFPKVP